MTLAGHLSRNTRFGRFLLEPERRRLSLDGVPVPLGSRAYDILQLLIERRDSVVSRDEILAEVWRGTVVEGNTLAVQISTLRRALGDAQVIATVPGRGYRFVATVQDDVLGEAEGSALRPAVGAREESPDIAVPDAPGRLPLAWRRDWLGWIATAALVVIAVGALGVRHVWTAREAPRLSIVVLPFRNLSADRQQDYLADAISDDLTTDLSHIPGSVVIARASADTYKGRAVAADAIGRALNVRYLLEGSLRAEGDALHINAQLIDAPSGSHLWASAFDVPRAELGGARSSIARHIASALNVTLVEIEGARSERDRPSSLDPQDYYLRARSILDSASTLPDFSRAQTLLERAVAISPDFPEALADLGLLLIKKISGFDDPDDRRDYIRANEVIAHALQLAPRSPGGVTAAGYLAWVDGKCDEAEPKFQMVIAADTNNVEARTGLVRCALELGRMQGMIDNLTELLRIDPVGPQLASRQHLMGKALLMLGRPADALVWLQRAGAGEGKPSGTEGDLGWHEWRRLSLIAATELSGNHALATAEYAEYARIWPNRTVWHLSEFDSHALSLLKGNVDYRAALQRAGMPLYGKEDQDFGVARSTIPKEGGDFDATPLTVLGVARLTTPEVNRLMSMDHKPLLLDYGRGAGLPRGAIWMKAVTLSENDVTGPRPQSGDGLGAGAPDIIVMSDGPLGWISHNASLRLAGKTRRRVFWYRGGEEAWAAARLPSEDRRSP